MIIPPVAEDGGSAEPSSAEIPQGEALCNILQGLFHCLRDLNTRVAVLEEEQASRAGGV